MYLIVDGIIYRYKTRGGISRIFDNILPRMCDLDPELKISLFHHWEIERTLPHHKSIDYLPLYKYDNWFRPWRLWHKAYPAIHNSLLRKNIGKTKEKIWFSTYYTTPPFHWDGKQVVFTHDLIHEMFPDILPNSKDTITLKKNALMNADAVICNSRSTAHDLQEYYPIPNEKIFVALLSADPIFRKRTEIEIRKKIDFPFILYVGRRGHYKGFNTFLNAYSHWKRNNEVKLIVVGPALTKEENDDIRNKHLENQVVPFIEIQDDMLCDLYNQAMAFVYPSLYEGFGIPLLEAMGCSCPIIASDIPSTNEVANDVPFYFEPGNEDNLINSLDYIGSTEATQVKIKYGLDLVKEYSWDKTSQQVNSVLQLISRYG